MVAKINKKENPISRHWLLQDGSEKVSDSRMRFFVYFAITFPDQKIRNIKKDCLTVKYYFYTSYWNKVLTSKHSTERFADLDKPNFFMVVWF